MTASARDVVDYPHPGVESAAANFAAGPFASVLERAGDVLGKAF